MDLRQFPVDQANVAKFAKTSKDARKQRATGYGRNKMLRESPAELFGDFESHRLRSLGVITSKVDICESPPKFVRDLRAQPVHIVVIPAHADEMWTEDR
jgi:hypothetical protein